MTEKDPEYGRKLQDLLLERRRYVRCIDAIEGQIKELKLANGVPLFE